MRKINNIVVHCSATPEGRDVKASDIKRWHVNDNKWKDIGYHYVVELDGTIVRGRQDAVVGAHVAGYNANTIGVCYIGGTDRSGKPKDTRNDKQKKALDDLLVYLAFKYEAEIKGHNNYTSAKACPSFDATVEYKYINDRLRKLSKI